MCEPQQDTEAWLRDFYAAGDALDSESWLRMFWTEDATLEFAGNPAVDGADSIQEFFASRFAALKSMKHTVLSVDIFPDKVWHEASITYVLKDDDQEVTLRACTVFGKALGETKISFSHSYLNPQPLMERKLLVEQRKK